MKLLLAGAEGDEQILALGSLPSPGILASYFYLRERRIHPERPGPLATMWTAMMLRASFRFIDSGGFTLRNALGIGAKELKVKGTTDLDPDHFLADYIDFLRVLDKRRLADAWCEVDIGAGVGARWIEQQRARIMGAGLAHGLVNVWHSNEHSFNDWIWLLKEARRPGRSNYVALEGPIPGQPLIDYPKFLREAYQRGVRVHGFKMTHGAHLDRFPFWSVDSTTWIMASKMGSFFIIAPTGELRQVRALTNRGQGTVAGRQLNSGEHLTWAGSNLSRQGARYRLDRMFNAAEAFLRWEQTLNQRWARRGVDWEHAIAHPLVVD